MCISLAFIGLLLLGLNQGAITGQEIKHGGNINQLMVEVHGDILQWKRFKIEVPLCMDSHAGSLREQLTYLCYVSGFPVSLVIQAIELP